MVEVLLVERDCAAYDPMLGTVVFLTGVCGWIFQQSVLTKAGVGHRERGPDMLPTATPDIR